MKCRLCNIETKSGIEIYGSQGVKLFIAKIISQYFPINLDVDDISPKFVCRKCWKITDQFHNLYCAVQKNEIKFKLKQNKVERLTTEPFLYHGVKQENDMDIVEPGLDKEEDAISTDHLVKNVKFEDSLNTDNDDKFVSNQFPGGQSSVKILKTKIKNILKRKPKSLINDLKPQMVIVKKNYVSKNEVIEQEEKIRNELEIKCEICNEQSTSFSTLKSHIRSVHSITGYIRCCGKKYFRRGKIYAHIRDHSNFGKYKCDKCDKIFVDKARFDAHVFLHDPKSRKHPCNICLKRFLSPSALKDHLITVHSTTDAIKNFICDICGKSFITKKWLSAHMDSHSQKYHQICDVCARIFNSRKLLNEHYKTKHMGIPLPKHQCTICGKWMTTNSSLKWHQRIHNAKEETCHICGKHAPNINALNDHIRYVHSGRVFECQMCMKVLKSRKSLKEHMASHTGISLYKCPYCSMEFNSNGNMCKHRKNMHLIEYQRDRERRLIGSTNSVTSYTNISTDNFVEISQS